MINILQETIDNKSYFFLQKFKSSFKDIINLNNSYNLSIWLPSPVSLYHTVKWY